MITLGMTRAQLERRYTELLLAAYRAELSRRRRRSTARSRPKAITMTVIRPKTRTSRELVRTP